MVANTLAGLNLDLVYSRLGPKQPALVLMYHSVVRDDCPYAEGNFLHVRESDFRWQMEFLSRHYECVSLASLERPARSNRPVVAVSFDDGYMNNRLRALPILKEYCVPATVFLVTDTIGRGSVFWFDKLYWFLGQEGKSPVEADALIDEFKERVHPSRMDAEVDAMIAGRGYTLPEDLIADFSTMDRTAVDEMHATGLVQFGSHTHRHELLTKIAADEAYRTLKQSFDILQTIPGNNGYFCYPNGYYDRAHVAMVRDIGYVGAVAVRPGDAASRFELPRLGVGRDLSHARFRLALSGLLDKLSAIKHAFDGWHHVEPEPSRPAGQ